MIGAACYGVGAAGFLVLFLLLLTSWRGRLRGVLLLLAVFVSLLWAVVAAVYAATEFRQGMPLYALAEVVRTIIWLAFLLQLLAPLALADQPPVRWRGWYGGLVSAGLLLILLDWFPQQFVGVDLSIAGHVGLAIGGLVLIEQLFRNTRPERRWATKFLYLGLGTLFAYDFYLYADALLFKRIDVQTWYARGLVNGLVVPLIAVSAARNPDWSLDVFVSRRMVIHSAAVFGAGLYLLVMAAVGYYIRFYGGVWGTAIQLVFLVGAGVLLAALLFSGQLRAGMRLFLSQHFFSYKYDYREEWLKFIHTLSVTDGDGSLREQAIRALADIVHGSGGLLWTRRDSGQFNAVAAWNLSEQGGSTEPGDSAFVEYLERQQGVIELEACEMTPELYPGFQRPNWLLALPRAWLVVPLLHGNHLTGFIVLAQPLVRQRLTWEDHDLLKTAGRQVASYVTLLDTSEALLEARQFEAFNRLSAFVVHDLKNVVAQLSLVVANAVRHKHNPAFVDDAIRTVENAAARMNQLLAQLRKDRACQLDRSHRQESRWFELAPLLREVVAARAGRQPLPQLVGVEDGLLVQVNRERCGAVLQHLVQNAQEATGAGGRVELKAYRQGDRVVIEISDDGCGMEPHFIRERLFRPFQTTKGNAGMGIGVYESREFIQASGGHVEVVSQPGAGTTFLLYLPLSVPAGPLPVPAAEVAN